MRCVDYQLAKTLNVFQCKAPVWSVAWNRSKGLAYGGLTNGDIVEFDTRKKGKDPTREFKTGVTMPVHSMQFKNNGLLTGSGSSLDFLKNLNFSMTRSKAQYKSISWIPLDGSPVCSIFSPDEMASQFNGSCMSFHEKDSYIVTTFRRNDSQPPNTLVAKLQFGCGQSQVGFFNSAYP